MKKLLKVLFVDMDAKMLNLLKLKILKYFLHNRQNKRWSEYEYFNSEWKKRIDIMASLIDGELTVVDLGCGQMWLKDMLDNSIQYIGVDYTPRDHTTIVCDLNKHEYPNVFADLYFMSGILEYIDDIDDLICNICRYSKSIIFSYCSIETVSDIGYRKRLGWKNHLKLYEVINLMIKYSYRQQGDVVIYKENNIVKVVKG